MEGETNMIDTTQKGLGHMTPTRRMIFEMLVRRDMLSRAALVEAVWGDDPDGGPIDPHRNLDVHLVYLRRALAPHGIAIETKINVGWRIAPEHKAQARKLLEIDDTLGWRERTSRKAVAVEATA